MKKSALFWTSILLTAVGVGVLTWFCIRGVYFEHFIDSEGAVSLEQSSYFGDFMGGTGGTIFALVGVFLLFETLKLQRKESANSSNVFVKQQFDNTFFGLVNIYENIVEQIGGKAFFANEQQKIQQRCQIKQNIRKSKQYADEEYVQYYLTNQNNVAHYFRTLYRIFSFIDESNLKEEDKVAYAKIMRAQLSEGELFFIYYNAFTLYGENFQCLINKYNLLKHLPKLQKIEFFRYATLLKNNEIHAVELVLYEIRKMIGSSLENSGNKYNPKINLKTYLKGKYSFYVYFESKFKLEFKIIIQNSVSYTANYQQGIGLDKYNTTNLTNLFRDYFIDLLTFSSFCVVNDISDICIRTSSNIENTKETITFSISRFNNKPLVFNPNKIMLPSK